MRTIMPSLSPQIMHSGWTNTEGMEIIFITGVVPYLDGNAKGLLRCVCPSWSKWLESTLNFFPTHCTEKLRMLSSDEISRLMNRIRTPKSSSWWFQNDGHPCHGCLPLRSTSRMYCGQQHALPMRMNYRFSRITSSGYTSVPFWHPVQTLAPWIPPVNGHLFDYNRLSAHCN